MRHGNAIYILFDDWEELSKLSRVDLLKGEHGGQFERIIHTGDWQDRVRKVLAKKLVK